MMKISSEQAMKEFGARLGARLTGGECLELVGDVGAGKTTFVKGLAAGLAIDDDVQSPSFTISRTYDARDGLHLAHYDFYRLTDPGILADELHEAAGQNDVVVVIEWADIVQGVLPGDRLTIRLMAVSENEREVACEAHGPQSRKLLKEIA